MVTVNTYNRHINAVVSSKKVVVNINTRYKMRIITLSIQFRYILLLLHDYHIFNNACFIIGKCIEINIRV